MQLLLRLRKTPFVVRPRRKTLQEEELSSFKSHARVTPPPPPEPCFAIKKLGLLHGTGSGYIMSVPRYMGLANIHKCRAAAGVGRELMQIFHLRILFRSTSTQQSSKKSLALISKLGNVFFIPPSPTLPLAAPIFCGSPLPPDHLFPSCIISLSGPETAF